MLYCPDQAVRQKKHERWGESGRKGRGMQASKINTGKKKRKKTVIIYKCYEVENIKESRDKLLTLPSVLDTKSKKYITFLYISS